ncbi:hypothetical protein B0T09DRAFT_75194 [Sordaria sp. MPI-SDFR-AT-0083]|nr:hypothetical protein B0T09DRAFT_75194 [Sordaria sp. MPI-SDFR-AT-0083]
MRAVSGLFVMGLLACSVPTIIVERIGRVVCFRCLGISMFIASIHGSFHTMNSCHAAPCCSVWPMFAYRHTYTRASVTIFDADQVNRRPGEREPYATKVRT